MIAGHKRKVGNYPDNQVTQPDSFVGRIKKKVEGARGYL